jgi:hypothetical protein
MIAGNHWVLRRLSTRPAWLSACAGITGLKQACYINKFTVDFAGKKGLNH